MDEKRLWEYGRMTAFVVAQLPLGTAEGQRVMRAVVDSCMSSCCKSEEEKGLFRRGMLFSSPEEEADFYEWNESCRARRRSKLS